MTSTQLYRVSGLVLLIGAVAFVAHNALGLIGAVLVLLGLPAMYARVAAVTGWPGLAGVVLIAVAWLFFGVFLSLYAMLLLSWLADSAPSLVGTAAPLPVGFVVAFVAGLIAWLAGTVLLAIPFMRGRLRPRWVGYVLLASGLWVVVGNLIIAPSGPATNLAINLLSNLGPVLLLVPVGYLGFRMWIENAPDHQTEPTM